MESICHATWVICRHRQGTPGEGSLRQKRPPDVFAYPPALMKAKEFRALRGAPGGVAPRPHDFLKKIE